MQGGLAQAIAVVSTLLPAEAEVNSPAAKGGPPGRRAGAHRFLPHLLVDAGDEDGGAVREQFQRLDAIYWSGDQV
jgi:hypothetical protein